MRPVFGRPLKTRHIPLLTFHPTKGSPSQAAINAERHTVRYLRAVRHLRRAAGAARRNTGAQRDRDSFPNIDFG